MQPLSNDLRKRILDAVDKREGSRGQLAVRSKVNTSTITKLLRLRRETGSIEPRPHAGGVAPTIVTAAIERAGASVLPLPPYSPDFNPIEEMSSKLKGVLRRVGARAKEHLYDAIGDGLREVTPQDILGWFRHAGMCVMQA